MLLPFPLNIHFGTLAGGLGCFPLDYGSYHSQSDSRVSYIGIRSLIGFSSCCQPLSHSVLYLLYLSPGASPKAISGRTSYLQVRLEFLRYPQLITAFFNTRVFGLPLDFTPTSPSPWIGHLVSGLLYETYPPFLKTRFPSGSSL